jgi:hypothetical protein
MTYDPLIAILVLGVAGAALVPLLLFVRWLELRAERRADETPAE